MKQLDNLFAQFPQLSPQLQEKLVKIAPWVALIFGILSMNVLFGLLYVSGYIFAGLLNQPLTGDGVLLLLTLLTPIIEGILLLLAFSKLKERQYRGWQLLFWVVILRICSDLLAMRFQFIQPGTIFVAFILGIGLDSFLFYLLFQIKKYYH